MTIIFDGNTAPWWAWVLEYLPLIVFAGYFAVMLIAYAIHEYRWSKRHNKHK